MSQVTQYLKYLFILYYLIDGYLLNYNILTNNKNDVFDGETNIYESK